MRKQKFVYPAAFVILLVLSLVYKYILNNQASGMVIKNTQEVTTVTEEEQQEQKPEEAQTCRIYICGAVSSPGVFTVPCGSILNDVVELAGGLTEDAPSDRLNLVYELNENISIYIPTRAELEEGITTDPLIIRTDYVWGNEQEQQQDQNLNLSSININTATREQLMTLPGIGEATADAIISYREEHEFTTTEDLMNVQGIGESKYNRIKDMICV